MAALSRSVKIGPIEVDPAVVLAPMAGVTNAAFRQLCQSYGAGLYVSEMISARALVEGNEKTTRMVTFADDEQVKSIQLYGVAPNVVAAATRRLVDEIGIDHLDMNFGCPMPKVTKLGGGAALPLHVNLFGAIVNAAVQAAGTVPVTVKMRIGIDTNTPTYLDAARRAADAGVAAISLHARTAEQLYSGNADWGSIATLKRAIDGVPVLGNGDIWVADDGVRMMRETGCDGVVVGRGCLGKPWLFRDLADACAGRPVEPPPTLGAVVTVMRHHARLLAEHFADELIGVRDFRKHVGWYLTGYPVGGEVRRSAAQTSSLAELDDILLALDGTIALPSGAERFARGHTRGPKPVALPSDWRDTVEASTPPAGADLDVSGG